MRGSFTPDYDGFERTANLITYLALHGSARMLGGLGGRGFGRLGKRSCALGDRALVIDCAGLHYCSGNISSLELEYSKARKVGSLLEPH